MDEEQKRLLEELLFSGEKKLSFAKLLYFGNFHTASVLPFPSPSSAEKQQTEKFMKELRLFVTDKIKASKWDKESSIPDSIYKELGKLGVLGMTVPKEYGGLGLSQHAYGQAVSLLAQHCGSTALFVNAHQSIGSKALVLFGTDEQKKRWLPPLSRGEIYAAFSLTEPNAGSDAGGIQTRATWDPEKKVYRIKGEKQWTSNGSIAGFLTVMARTEVETERGIEDRITAFIVSPDMPGFRIKDATLDKVGMRGSTTSNLIFDNIELPPSNILGKKGEGLKLALTVLDYGRTTFGAACSGPAQMLLKMAKEHATNRYQFKKPLASFGMVKRMVSRTAARAYAIKATTELVQGLVDRGEEEFLLESAILKVFASEALWDIIYDTMQIYGGRSFFTDMPLERIMRDCRLNMIGEGSNEVLRVFIAAVGLRDVGMQFESVTKAIKHPIKRFDVLRQFGRQGAAYLHAPSIPLQTSHLVKEADLLSRYLRRFALANARLLVKYREEIAEKQLALDRVCNIVTALFTVSAVIGKLDTELVQAKKETAEELADDLASGKLYCQMAFDVVDRSLQTLFHNYDTEIEKLSNQLTLAKRS